VLIAAALCPSPPLLARELTGADPVVPELRQACLEAAAALVAAGPDVVAVVGVAGEPGERDARGRLDLAAFAPALCSSDGEGSAGAAALPASLGLGAMLLDQAGYRGDRVLHAVTEDSEAGACAALGARLSGSRSRVALLVMADGSARRTLRAPGYLDERSAPFDAGVTLAIAAGDLGDLLALDAGLARDLMATGRPVLQVLAGAAAGLRCVSEMRYGDDPFGVWYLVASLGFPPP
jgi:hypothetical protein